MDENNEEKVVEGLSFDETELLVIQLQDMVYQLKEKLNIESARVEEAKLALAKAEGGRDYTRNKLLAVVKFLSIYNAEAHEDWFAELGLERK